MYLIYILKDGDVPFYVGKARSLKRVYSHEKYALSGNSADLGYGLVKDYNPHKTRKIRKLLREGGSVNYEVTEFADEASACAEEERLISLFGRHGIDAGGILTNIHPGGNGGDVFSALSDEAKANAHRKRAMTLASLPDEVRYQRNRRLSVLRKQMMASMPDHKKQERAEKIARARRGKKYGPSPKKGKPATGGNQKGVRRAWNVGKECPAISKGMAAYNATLDRQWSGHTPFRLLDPFGNTVEGNNVEWLTENHNVTSRILPLIRGQVSVYKGWTRAD